MRGKANALGHSIHPMLIVFPLGILPLVVVFDIVHFATGNATWATLSFWCNVIGGGMALVAAVPGFIDWLSLPSGTRANRIGAWHAVVNVTAVGCFVASFIVRLVQGITGAWAAAFVLALLGVCIALVGGWLGGELVEKLGVSVHPDASLNAPSSLTGARAHTPLATPGEPQPI